MSRNHLSHVLMIVLLLLTLTACAEGEEAAVLPTEFVFPTLTATFTPSITPSPEEPTATFTPSLTATATATLTASPTATTAASPTPLFTLTPSLSPTNTVPPATSTPEASPTTNAPEIVSFTASTNSVAPGAPLTLTWDAIGDSARIERLTPQSIVAETFPNLPLNGNLTVNVPSGQGSQVLYQLVVTRGGQTRTSLISINIAASCAIEWFFGNQFAPPGAGCPTAPASNGTGAFQAFERGRMIYVNTNGQNIIYALSDPTQAGTQPTYGQSLNGWDGSSTFPCAQNPPAGFVSPQQMFAWLYCNTLPPSAVSWNAALGWATGPIDLSNRTTQQDQSGAVYVDTPAGNIYRLAPIPPGQISGTYSQIR